MAGSIASRRKQQLVRRRPRRCTLGVPFVVEVAAVA
jgi:hypothetical protein